MWWSWSWVWFLCMSLLSLLIVLSFIFLVRMLRKRKESVYPLITCLMITGKDPSRKCFAKAAVANFREQTYRQKHLVILNHGPFTVLDGTEGYFNVTEIKVEKDPATTLGDLRNMSLEFVPMNGLWCVWDDDDLRRPDFLYLMHQALDHGKYQGACFTKRLEYNLESQFAWKTTLKSGFYHVLATKDYRLRYRARDTGEDLEIIHDMIKLYPVVLLENDPKLYTRIVHSANTSVYVVPNKKSVIPNPEEANWREVDLNEQEKMYVQKVVEPWTQDIFKCNLDQEK